MKIKRPTCLSVNERHSLLIARAKGRRDGRVIDVKKHTRTIYRLKNQKQRYAKWSDAERVVWSLMRSRYQGGQEAGDAARARVLIGALEDAFLARN